jgi:hypothetical protein
MPTTKEYHYECDRPCYEEISDNRCPHCGARDCIEEATRCLKCGDFFFLDGETKESLCDECLDDYKTIDNALKIGEEYKTSVSGINEFVTEALTPEEINRVLTEYVKTALKDSSAVRRYCDGDIEFFVEWVEANCLNDDEKGDD